MHRSHRRQHKTRPSSTSRAGRRRAAPPRSPSDASPPRTLHDPLFGHVPAVWLPYDAAGRYGCWAFDPSYRPPLPRGAVRGDVARQVYCRLCHAPQYYYVDQPKTCVQCGAEFTFAATEQKYWYETLQFRFDSTAIRCPECRRRQRSRRAVNSRLAAAAARRREAPDDPAALLDWVEAVVALHDVTGQGNLAGAVAACRRVQRRAPDLAAAWYWEARCHGLAGRSARAAECAARFLEQAGDDPRHARLVRAARAAWPG